MRIYRGSVLDVFFFVAFCLAFAGPFFDAICDTSVHICRRSSIACSGRLRLALFRRVFTLKMDGRLKWSIFWDSDFDAI